MALFTSRRLAVLYLIAIVFKGIDGMLECAGGIALFFVSKAKLHHTLVFLARQELAEDPDNLIAHHVLHLGKHLSLNTKTFVSIYLAGHGLIKLVLVVNLLRDKRWAFLAAIVVLLAFVGYQIIRLVQNFSATLTLFTAIDIAIVALIWLEYRNTLARKSGSA